MRSTCLAVACSDIHWSHNPPLARSETLDWYRDMEKTWAQVRELCYRRCPLLIAGDIFHRWNSPPELINFAIDQLKGLEVYAIPGQHDLPHHSLKDIKKSSYWTLVNAGVIHHVDVVEEIPCETTGGKLILWGFPWGVPFERCPIDDCGDEDYHIAMVHRYLWKRGHGFEGAPQEDSFPSLDYLIWQSYHYCLFGDNHQDFVEQSVINCGGLMRRNQDELDREPKVYELWSDGTIEPKKLSTKGEILLGPQVGLEQLDERMLEHFMEQIGNAIVTSMDFEGAIKEYLKRTPDLRPAIRKIILQAMEG